MSAIEIDKLLQAVLCILVLLMMAMVVEVMLEVVMRVMIHPALRRTLINQRTRQPGASHDWSILLTMGDEVSCVVKPVTRQITNSRPKPGNL